MPSWFFQDWSTIGEVAAKAALIYVVALLGFGVAHRRTLSQWTAIDFAAAVAIGAIIGRTAVAADQSFLAGAVPLITVLMAHAAVTMARYNRWAVKVVDHRVRVLIDHGRLRRDQLRICGLTENDVLSDCANEALAASRNCGASSTRPNANSPSSSPPGQPVPAS